MRNDETYESHRSALALFARFLLALIPVSVGYAGLILFFRSDDSISQNAIQSVTLLYRAIVFLLILEMVRRYYNDLYVFGHNRVIGFRGRLSFRYGRIAIAFKDIRDVGIKQSLMGRLLNYGTVTFGTASKDNYEVTMYDLPHPHRFASMIQDHIHRMRKQKAFFEAQAALDAASSTTAESPEPSHQSSSPRQPIS